MSPTPPKLLAPVNEKIYIGLYAPLAPRDLRPIQIMTFSVQLNEKKNSEWKTYFDLVPDPDLEIRGRGGGGGHPDP